MQHLRFPPASLLPLGMLLLALPARAVEAPPLPNRAVEAPPLPAGARPVTAPPARPAAPAPLPAPATPAAPVLRPDGPLQVTLYGPEKPKLTLGRGNDLVLVVGAPGHGPGSLTQVLYDDTIPKEAHPKVEVLWPAAKPGEKPIKELYELKERC